MLTTLEWYLEERRHHLGVWAALCYYRRCYAAGNEIAVKFYPGARGNGFADGAEVNLLNSHTANLAFHRNAFALVTRPLALPMGAPKAEYVPYDGLGIRVVQSYDISKKKDVISLDMLVGVKTLNSGTGLPVAGDNPISERGPSGLSFYQLQRSEKHEVSLLS